MTPDEWNKVYPPGTAVHVILDNGEVWPTLTRSAAWTLQSGVSVIQLTGRDGWYLLERVRPATGSSGDPALPAPSRRPPPPPTTIPGSGVPRQDDGRR